MTEAFEKALDVIAELEGFSAKAYPDADGYSIGYGHFILKSDPYTKDSVITETEARKLLEKDTMQAMSAVVTLVHPVLTVNQQAALISFAYNVGAGAFKNSTLLKKLNGNDLQGAALEFAKWNKSQGKVLPALINRRRDEVALFLKPDGGENALV